MANSHIRFRDIERYDPSESEDECTEKEKNLLQKYRKSTKKQSDSEEEVYGLEGSSDEDNSENESEIADSDVEGQEDDDLPDVRAWGQQKRAFYSTDYVDPDYGGYQGKDAQAAEIEEEEAKNIQQRLAEQLDDDDFLLDIFNKKSSETEETLEEVVKSDLSTLSKRELLNILKKESPEFFGLVEDLKDKMQFIKSNFVSIFDEDKEQYMNDKVKEFIKTYYHLILNYCTNIYMYLLLKASRVNMHMHPIIKRLNQYRCLITELEPVFTEKIHAQIETVKSMNEARVENLKQKNRKKLNILKKLDDKKIKSSLKSKTKKVENDKDAKTVTFETEADEEAEENNEVDNEENNDEENSKRAITYQMAKNKGLTPRRNKEQRNPRVKHRNKYRKAKIRRKGAVREVRTEMTRYGGEISGIKASVSKSVKFK